MNIEDMNIIIIKLGGKLLAQGEKFNEVINDIAKIIKNTGKKVILIHGGGPQINDQLKRLGKEPRIVKSISGMQTRITDEETVEVAQMVMAGKLNKLLVSKFEKLNVKSVGLCGIDGGLIRAKRKDNIRIIDVKTGKKLAIHDDYSGRIKEINSELIKLLLKENFMPIIAPIGLGYEFESLNLDGDRVAGHIAAALDADTLLLFTDVKGVLINGEVVEKIGKEQIKPFLEKVSGGMKKKIYAANEALNLGVTCVFIGSGMVEKPISSILNGETGTAVSWKFI
ncbi:MAG: [LysW]-aminoadipate kinase [Candidatus Lokiarchaeota archaeon]|nr:[LysW]-aminoadipate kinase [Candidatus Lokiarchaeota archaeon]